MKKSIAALVVVVIAVAGWDRPVARPHADSEQQEHRSDGGRRRQIQDARLSRQAGRSRRRSRRPWQLTVFAPTDPAFAKVPKATLAALGKDKVLLKSVLLYHVAKGKVTAGKVVKLKSVKTLQGGVLAVRVSGGNVFIGKARVVTPDVMASNGVIHVINRVLIPPMG